MEWWYVLEIMRADKLPVLLYKPSAVVATGNIVKVSVKWQKRNFITHIANQAFKSFI